MSDFLAGKRAVITGASKGIGFAVAKALLESGADVVICGRRQEHLDAGQLIRDRKISIGYLPQEIHPLREGTVFENMLAHLGPGMARRWRDLGAPALDQPTVDTLSTAAEAAYGTDHYAELTEARDRAQVAVLRARELDDTDTHVGGDHR